MRTILMTVMLLIVAILIYEHTIGGSGGTKALLRDHADRINARIGEMSP